MFHKGLRLPGVSARGVYLRAAFACRRLVPAIALSLAAIVSLASPPRMLAQHGSGGGRSQPGANSRPVICVHDCVEPHAGLGDDDDSNLERLMAVQATPDQTTSFNTILKDVQAARDRLQSFIKLPKAPSASASDSAAMLDQTVEDHAVEDQAVEKIRTASQNLLASFSPIQKSGLKDVARKVETADSDLDKQRTAFDRALQAAKADSAPVAASAANLDNALASFQNQQLALGREMSIVLPSDGQDLSFILDLQQNIAGVLRSLLTRSPRCGERLEIQHASLTPLDPASLVVLRLHFERWICPGGSPMELASSEGTVEIKLTPSIELDKIDQTKIDQNKIEQTRIDQTKIDQNAIAQHPVEPNSTQPNPSLHLASEFGRVDADGVFRESLLSGSLGDTVREQVAAVLFPAMQNAANLKSTLPPVAQDSAIFRKAQFQDAGAGQLRLVLDGQLQLSGEQTKQFAAQLKQPISAKETSAP
jgi:hypothetical protein